MEHDYDHIYVRKTQRSPTLDPTRELLENLLNEHMFRGL